MGNRPKLKVTGLGWDAPEEIWEFDQARYFPYAEWIMIVAEGRVVKTFEELVAVAERDENRNKEFLEINFLPIVVGG